MDKKLGKRIKEMREKRGISQKSLAESLGVARTTISQIERGERKVTADELISLSKIFNVSVETLLGLKQEPKIVLQGGKITQNSGLDMRINVPQKNLEKFKEILLYILNKVGSKPNIGETVLYKLLYFVDFDFYEKYEEQLIGATYIKNHYGPTPVEFKKIVEKMINEEEIVKVENTYFKYPQTKYLPLRRADLTKLMANEIEVIDEVLNRLSDMNASQISEYSHWDVPWLTTADQEVIKYESVFYRTPPYSVRVYHEDI